MKVIAKTDFVHGVYSATRGAALDMPDGIASDLEKAGFVSKSATASENKQIGPQQNKSTPPRGNASR